MSAEIFTQHVKCGTFVGQKNVIREKTWSRIHSSEYFLFVHTVLKL